ncbi:GTP-binding protein Rho1 [Gnomoniopsis sp. IMI 355080]|nr:GTP-binding protein Rho1 [Gnomoniopsis sp. IMI 355080]
MDHNTRPESTVGSACQALISTAHQVSADVTNFVRRCRSARTDLAPVTRELSELQMVLQLLNDFEAQRGVIPAELQAHLRPILANCIGVACKVHDVLRRQEVAGWTAEARDEVGELIKSLSVHRGVVGVVTDLISVLVSRAVPAENKSNDEHAQIPALLEELQALGSSLVISYSNATLAREHFALQVHLGQIANYTETLARTDLWQDAVRTLDEADEQTSDKRSSTALPTPLGRGHLADRSAAAGGVRNSGLENLLPLGPPEMYEGNRPPSMSFTPKRVPDPRPPAEIESAGPSGTGFIVMEGFMNSAQGAASMSSEALHDGGVQKASEQHLTVPGSESKSSQRSDEIQTSGELSSARLNREGLQPIPSAIRDSASGLQVLIPDEKELAVSEVVSDEALAFAQVPIHVLDRLSVNLVGQVYGGPSSAEDKSSDDQSQSLRRTSPDEAGCDRSGAALAHTSNIGVQRDGPSYMSQKPLPRGPLVYIPNYPGQFIKRKVVVVGNFSCGKTSLITKADELRITETLKLSVDEAPIQLCLWDIRGIDYDPSWLYGAHVALVCFSVNIGATDSKGKHLGRVRSSAPLSAPLLFDTFPPQWVAEVNRNCPGAAILLVGLKADIRFHAKSVEKLARRGKALVTPEQGEQFRENIGATRYVECSARTGEGVQDVLAETARVAMQVGRGMGRHGRKSSSGGGRRPLSRIGKFFGFGMGDG